MNIARTIVSLGSCLLAGATVLAAPVTSVARFPLTREYDPDMGIREKQAAVASTVSLFRDLGIEVVVQEGMIRTLVESSNGDLEAHEVRDSHLLYDAIYYLTDLARLPPELYALFPRVAVVEGLRARDPRSKELESVPLAWEPRTRTVLADHSNLNQLELFGGFLHPKVNFAMMLQVALEGRLRELGPAVLRELGLDIVVDDREWARLNGGHGDGWSAYNREDLTFVGVRTAARVTPPGMVFDALRELSTGVPASSYAGMAEPTQPWWSPRHGPAADRQAILRSMFSRSPMFFDRIGGAGVRPDEILKEKTRLVLYAAFVGSGGVLDGAYWKRRHPGNTVVSALASDFDAAFFARLDERLARNPATAGTRLAP